ncbi:MAG: right-handed parallel beta-helix repeat-containing protein [Desulfuromonadales bacterium]|nr:right-handed parallel beta-helix repeat-containing protein [Desulfuromonadales bacterium]
MLKKKLFSFVLTLFLAAPALAAPIKSNTTWSGTVTLKEMISVEKGATLTLAPGTIVRASSPEAGIAVSGTIKVNGSAAAPIVLSGAKGWKGIMLNETGAAPHRVSHARFSDAENGISLMAGQIDIRHSEFRNCDTGVKLVREGKLLLEDSLFEKNGVGVANEMKSVVTIQRNRFISQSKSAIIASHGSSGAIEKNTFEKNEQAIGLMQTYPGKLSQNRFLNNKVGIYCNQTQNTPQILDSTFEGNEIAVVNFSFSYPAIENSTFLNNGTAIRNDQFGSPKVSRNLLRGNKLAIYNYRKSNPVIEYNLIDANDKALYCDFSSYPVVKNNNFTNNKMGVELGIYQSADWEKRSGSRTIVQKEAESRNSKNPLLSKAPTTFKDFVDVSGNWWGNDTKALIANPKGNHPFYYDRKDKARVTYDGFGPDSYLLDEIRYHPWLSAAVAPIGPEKKK